MDINVPSQSKNIPICGFWKRIQAFLLDLVLLAFFGLLLGLFLGKLFTPLGIWGRSIGFIITILYFGILNSSIGKGQTVGKGFVGIQVVTTKGQFLRLDRSLLRSGILIL